MTNPRPAGWLGQLRERGVLRAAASYAVIAWLLLQIADVTFEPLGLPAWSMPALIITAILGFPITVALAWFYELGDDGIARDSAPSDTARPRVHGVRRYADVAIIGALLIAVAVLLVRQSDFGKPPPPEKPSLAVLPFENLSGDDAQAYFSDGLAEEVLDRLGQVPGLMVVARSSSFSFRDQGLDVRTIAERLGVAVVLEGAVRRDGRRLRLSAKLIDGKSGYQLWSGSFDREVTDVFAVQEELAQAVIDAIVPVARGDAHAAVTATPPTTSLTAYDRFLLGRSAQTLRGPAGAEYLRKSVEHFEQALKLDPGFARAHGALANSLVLLMMYDGTRPAGPGRAAPGRVGCLQGTLAEPGFVRGAGRLCEPAAQHAARGRRGRLSPCDRAEPEQRRGLARVRRVPGHAAWARRRVGRRDAARARARSPLAGDLG